MSTPAMMRNSSAPRCCALPTEIEPRLIAPGFARAAAIRSPTVLWGLSAGTSSTWSNRLRRPTGVKSLDTS